MDITGAAGVSSPSKHERPVWVFCFLVWTPPKMLGVQLEGFLENYPNAQLVVSLSKMGYPQKETRPSSQRLASCPQSRNQHLRQPTPDRACRRSHRRAEALAIPLAHLWPKASGAFWFPLEVL